MIIDRIAKSLKLSSPYLEKLAKTASHRYKEYEIAKRTGGKRIIHHPARELKLVQHWILRNVLVKLPVHSLATAYQKGSSIRQNAELHVANNYILRVDFQDFFPSLRGDDVTRLLSLNPHISAGTALTQADLDFIRRIVCRRDCLTIGSPTSPYLSNAIMFDFDKRWSETCQGQGIAYSRYADDLYFSTNRPMVLHSILADLREFLRTHTEPNLKINERKTWLSSRKRRKVSTGLILTSDRRISLGRKKKRALRAKVNSLRYHELDPQAIHQLRGWIAYARSIEPLFVVSLERKYKLDFSAAATWRQ